MIKENLLSFIKKIEAKSKEYEKLSNEESVRASSLYYGKSIAYKEIAEELEELITKEPKVIDSYYTPCVIPKEGEIWYINHVKYKFTNNQFIEVI